MLTIHKYELERAKGFQVEIPRGAKFVACGPDPAGALCVWCEVDPDAPKIRQTFAVLFTGTAIDEKEHAKRLHLATVLDRALVLHVYASGDVRVWGGSRTEQVITFGDAVIAAETGGEG